MVMPAEVTPRGESNAPSSGRWRPNRGTRDGRWRSARRLDGSDCRSTSGRRPRSRECAFSWVATPGGATVGWLMIVKQAVQFATKGALNRASDPARFIAVDPNLCVQSLEHVRSQVLGQLVNHLLDLIARHDWAPWATFRNPCCSMLRSQARDISFMCLTTFGQIATLFASQRNTVSW